MNSKQRAYLRGLANNMPAIFQIGKGGMNENMINQIYDALEARELIKVSVLENSLLSAREVGQEIANQVGAETVQFIGNKFVLYKKSEKKPTIILP